MTYKLVEKYNFPFEKHLYYDETSPSCLRWTSDRFTGIHRKIIIATKDSIAGTLSKQHNRYVISINGVKYQASCIVCKLNCLSGYEKLGELVAEHKDKDSTNNKVSNLRITTQTINLRNSGKRKTNTSGKIGVHKTIKCSVIYFVASYTDLNGKLKSKWFSTKKLGYEAAFRSAGEFRDNAIIGMNEMGAGYTEDHL